MPLVYIVRREKREEVMDVWGLLLSQPRSQPQVAVPLALWLSNLFVPRRFLIALFW